MSRSPKYTTAYLAAQRQQELARQRAARDAARVAAAAAAAVALAATRAAQKRAELKRQERRLDALRETWKQAGAQAETAAIRRRITAVDSKLKKAQNLAVVDSVTADIAAIDASITRGAEQVASVLAARERAGSLDAVRGVLDADPSRAELDPAGDARVTALLSRAAEEVADPGRFGLASRELTAAVREHLDLAARRGQDLAAAREDAESVLGSVGRVLDEARAAGAALPGLDQVAAAAARLRSDMTSLEAAECRRGTAVLRQAEQSLGAALEEWLGQLDRAQQVVEAAAAALPRAGFALEPGSLTRDGTTVTFRALRSDGSGIDIGVSAGSGTGGQAGNQGVRVTYRGQGPDYVTEHTVDGTVATCDVTASMLERFHQELSREDVETDGLYWDGQPDKPLKTAVPRPVSRAAGAHRSQR